MQSDAGAPKVGRREQLAWGLLVLVSAWAAWLSVRTYAPTLLLSNADRDRLGVQDVVRAALKDPDSARFGPIWSDIEGKYACGEVNAKNAMGGYVGSTQFLLQRSTGLVEFMPPEPNAPDGSQENIEQLQKRLKFIQDIRKFCG